MEVKSEEKNVNLDTGKVSDKLVYPAGEKGWEQVNQKYLDIFEADLKAAGRSKRIKGRDMRCAEIYLNYFLFDLTTGKSPDVDVDTFEIKDENRGALSEGCHKFGFYISYYYIRKDLSATPYNLEQTVQAIKNFYESMMNHGCVSKDDYEDLCGTIDCDMDLWLERCEQMCVEAFGEEEWRKMRKGETYFI